MTKILIFFNLTNHDKGYTDNDKKSGLVVNSNSDSSSDTKKSHCEEYYKCKAQNGVAFGCVPLSTITLYTGSPTHWETIPDIIQSHLLVKQCG